MGNSFGGDKSPAVRTITHHELYNIQADISAFYVLVDVRNREDYKRSRIDLAFHEEVPLDTARVKEGIKIILYGESDLDLTAKSVKKTIKRWSTGVTPSSPLLVLILSGGYRVYRDKYPFLCTDHVNYVEGRLFASQIGERVFLSNFGVASNPDVITLLGISHIINCTVDCPFVDCSSPEEHPNLTSLVKLRVPVVDERDQQICEHFQTAIEFIQSALSSDISHRVLIHCKHGQSRSATVAAAWLIARQELTVDAALQHLRICRPKVRPNEGFISQLKSFSWEAYAPSKEPNAPS